jgi:hypothetical protein
VAEEVSGYLLHVEARSGHTLKLLLTLLKMTLFSEPCRENDTFDAKDQLLQTESQIQMSCMLLNHVCHWNPQVNVVLTMLKLCFQF